ncbi:MAG: DUF1289 domain-containing protein [Gammaproteobacteria bacterium]
MTSSLSMSPQRSRRAPESPCVDVCRLNERGICEGCLRSIDEIAGWSGMTAEEQWRVLGRIERRRSEELEQ